MLGVSVETVMTHFVELDVPARLRYIPICSQMTAGERPILHNIPPESSHGDDGGESGTITVQRGESRWRAREQGRRYRGSSLGDHFIQRYLHVQVL